MKKKVLDKKVESLRQSCEVLLKKNGIEMPKDLQYLETDIETANLQIALWSFWVAYRETFGLEDKGKCYEDYLEIRDRLHRSKKEK